MRRYSAGLLVAALLTVVMAACDREIAPTQPDVALDRTAGDEGAYPR